MNTHTTTPQPTEFEHTITGTTAKVWWVRGSGYRGAVTNAQGHIIFQAPHCYATETCAYVAALNGHLAQHHS